MAHVVPFRGLHFNPEHVRQLADVVTPPYDVIKPDEREAFAARHSHNMVHLILPLARPGDDTLHNRYTRAAALFHQWQQEAVLVRDPVPAYYFWETEFEFQGKRYNRAGLTALVRLEPFSSGVILPHEQTFSAHKADRLELMKHARAQFSPIFSLFPDHTGAILDEVRNCLPTQPLMAFKDSQGLFHRFYRVTDPACLGAVYQAFQPLTLYIADGHHRYETALAYQKWVRERYPNVGPQAPFNYMLMYLANLYDPDMVIKMAHRLLTGPRLQHLDESRFVRRLADYFDITPLATPGSDFKEYSQFLQAQLDTAAPEETCFILVGFGLKARRLQLRPGVRQKVLTQQMHPALAQLDVAVLNYLIFDKTLGLDARAQDDPETCKYTTVISDALTAIQKREVKLAFLLNPTRIEQVRQVAEAGLIMPRKSTYFYPKVMTGLILNPLNVEEEIILPAG